jgi:nitrite reductase/ring-hydroxylating ferredoxin subunit
MAAELPPFPAGWYSLGLARSWGPGAVHPVRLAGREWVIWRSQSGSLQATTATCPHLGAHLGHGGRVVGDHIECPFHGFRFDGQGRCVATAYGSEPPERATLGAMPVIERDGLVLAWHDPRGVAPWFDVPKLEAEGWCPPELVETTVRRAHPQETTENSVDLGHFSTVHGYTNVGIIEPVALNGERLTIGYKMTRANPFIPGFPPINSEFRVMVVGLGWSLVEISVPAYHLRFRLFVLPQPTDGRDLTVRLAVSHHRSALPAPVRFLGRIPAVSKALARVTVNGVAHDVEQDRAIWENKAYVERPVLARGDGPIGVYRQYCKRFYPETSAAV